MWGPSSITILSERPGMDNSSAGISGSGTPGRGKVTTVAILEMRYGAFHCGMLLSPSQPISRNSRVPLSKSLLNCSKVSTVYVQPGCSISIAEISKKGLDSMASFTISTLCGAAVI